MKPLRSTLSGLVLGLRYTVRVEGLDQVAQRGTSGILFLPNHPALIDPVILMTVLYDRFRPRALGDRDQIDRFFVRNVARHLRAIEMPDLLREGAAVRDEVRGAISACATALRDGDNLVLYPAGHLQTERLERLGGSSAVSTLLEVAVGCRVVLVRITGLWGSRFGWAGGRQPLVAPVLLRGAAAALASGGFFMPRRRVTVELEEPAEFPRKAPREELNRYLERFYNADPQPALHVPLTLWARGGRRQLPESRQHVAAAGDVTVPTAVRQSVIDHLRTLTGVDEIGDRDRLADDLVMDSLQRAELAVWLEDEFGAPRGDIDALVTVADALRVASGRTGAGTTVEPLQPIPGSWFRAPTDTKPPSFFDRPDLVTAFLAAARSAPGLPILADQTAGVRTYGQMLVGIAALQPTLAALGGSRIGVMLPATVGADVLYFALLCSGKTPVMVNWTVGTRNVRHALESVGCDHVLTARALVARLADQGVDLSPLEDRLVFLEDVVARLGTTGKIRALLRARLRPGSLVRRREEDIAVILFTSGSENLPKAVPLTDRNILTNLRDIFARVPFVAGDRLLSVLPPFHSFGLTAGMLMPLLGRIPTVHFPVPTDGAMLARLVEAYEVTLMGGTPTFLGAMVRAAAPGQLSGLRLAVTGGETMPERIRTELAEASPKALVLEGYGITECSPIVSINAPGDSRTGTVGKPLPSVRHRVVVPDSTAEAGSGDRGELLVSGPSIFEGYLGAGVPSPFVELDGHQWYRTGDLVREDADGFLTFEGRLRRFVKLGGEMISLPAIEGVLESAFPEKDADGPILAIEATADAYNPEVVLFSTQPLTRAEANQAIRAAGLSPLHAVRRIVHLETMPTLGTGKVDYRGLRRTLDDAGAAKDAP